ncbi:hypothetical protein Tco_0969980 [Tanacetum coccineum]
MAFSQLTIAEILNGCRMEELKYHGVISGNSKGSCYEILGKKGEGKAKADEPSWIKSLHSLCEIHSPVAFKDEEAVLTALPYLCHWTGKVPGCWFVPQLLSGIIEIEK